MRANLLTNSSFGKFYASSNKAATKTIQLQKIQEIKKCKLTLQHERLYLLDSSGKLYCLNLKDHSLSTLVGYKLQYFHPDSFSSLSLTAISPTSQILSVRFESKQVTKVFNPCLNSLISFQKNYLTQTILLLQTKLLVLIENNKKMKSLKAKGNELFVSACLLGINSHACVLLRSGQVQIYQTSTLKLVDSITLPFAGSQMKVAATNKGKTIAIYGNNCWLFLLNFDSKLTCKLAQLPFSSVLDLQFSYSEQIILLASDRVLYGVDFGEDISLKPLFNEDSTFIPTGFDISIDEKLIAVAAGKAIHLVQIKESLLKTIKNAENSQIINFSQQSSSSRILQVNSQLQNGRSVQYKKKQSKKYQFRIQSYKPAQTYVNFSQQDFQFQLDQESNALFAWDKSLNAQNKKVTLKLYQWLSKHQKIYDIARSFSEKTVRFISKLFTIFNDFQTSASLSVQILLKISEVTAQNTLQKLALFIAPKLLQTFHKKEITINQFAIQLVLGLFQDYLPLQTSIDLLNLLASNINRQGFCATFLVVLIQKIIQNSEQTNKRQQISAKALQSQVHRILKQPQFSYLFIKPVSSIEQKAQNKNVEESEDIQVLIERQQRIKNALKTIRSTIE